MYFWVLQHFFMCFCVSVTSQLASLANCRLHSVDFTATVSIKVNQAANHKFNLRLLPVSWLYGAAALPLCFEVLSCCFLPQMTLICLETADIEEGKFAVDLEKKKIFCGLLMMLLQPADMCWNSLNGVFLSCFMVGNVAFRGMSRFWVTIMAGALHRGYLNILCFSAFLMSLYRAIWLQ